jgi:cobalt-zinc-cadmium efflux system outer membrane protein
MSHHRNHRWILCALPLSLAMLSGVAHATPLNTPLSFTTALELAEHQSPSLVANTAQINAAQSSAIPAGALPDPKLFIGIDNFPVTGEDRGHLNRDFMTMQKIGIMQEIPNADKRKAREAVASAGIDVASAQRQITRLQVRRDTAIAWLNVYYIERKFALFDALDQENKILNDAVKAQIAGGRSPVVDAIMPRQEAAQLADRRDELASDLAKARATLRRFVGMAANEPLAGEPPVRLLDAEHLRQQLHQHPELQAFVAQTRKAEAEVHEADAMKQSDWGVELAYQKRAPQYSDMISVQFIFDLPIATARRQDPLIAAKQQELSRIDADREAMLRDHANQLENDLADYVTLRRQLERAEQTALPLAQQKVDLQMASYKAGKSDLTSLLATRRELIDQRLKIIEWQARHAVIAAQLQFAYGETAP